MKKQRTIRRTLLAMAIAGFGMSASALAQTNTCPVDVSGAIDSPKMLDIGPLGAASDTSCIENASTTSPDLDYFGFVVSAEWLAEPGEKSVAVDIDEAHDPSVSSLDATLHLFDPDGIMVMRSFTTDPTDSGSNQADPKCVPTSTTTCPTRDPTLKYALKKPGVWKIAVSAAPSMLIDGGAYLPIVGNRAFSNGRYKLVVSGLQPSMQQVEIDIKPGSKEISHINPKSRGMIPVMVLSDKKNGFNPFDVEELSLKFGRKGNEESLGRCQKHGNDVNGDGMPDRLCHFDNEKTKFRPGDSEGILTGTFKGKAFEGRGDLKVHEKGAD
jgi:hypothetical protein